MKGRAAAWRWGVPAALAAALALLHVTSSDVGRFYGEWESAVYLRTAAAPLAQPIDPHHGYRLLPHALAGSLPLGLPAAYTVVDYASLFAAAWLLFGILAAAGFGRVLALGGALAFLAAPCSTKWLLAYSPGPDAFFMLAVFAAYRAIQARAWPVFALALAAGVLTKETVFVLVPVALLHGRRTYREAVTGKGLRESGRRALWALPALAIFAGIRILWPPDTASRYSWAQDAGAMVKAKFTTASAVFPAALHWAEQLAAFALVFGVLALVLVAFAPRAWRTLRADPALETYFWFQQLVIFIGTHDSERAELHAFAPVAILALRVMVAERKFFGRAAVWIPLAAGQLLFSDILRVNLSDYTAYMFHYMPLGTGLGYAAAWGAALLALAGLRLFFGARGRRVRARS